MLFGFKTMFLYPLKVLIHGFVLPRGVPLPLHNFTNSTQLRKSLLKLSA
jgi:hypothetical protein